MTDRDDTDLTEVQRKLDVPSEGTMPLPNGCKLFWKLDPSVNARTYFSDEVGGGVSVWNVALVDRETLTAAIYAEDLLSRAEMERESQRGRPR